MARILIAEDSNIQRKMLGRFLTKFGHEVVLVEHGARAIETLREKSPHFFDLVVTDIFMPELNGLELLELIQKEFPQLRVIAVSAGEDDDPADVLASAHKAGAVATFRKPYRPMILLESIMKTLKSSRRHLNRSGFTKS